MWCSWYVREALAVRTVPSSSQVHFRNRDTDPTVTGTGTPIQGSFPVPVLSAYYLASVLPGAVAAARVSRRIEWFERFLKGDDLLHEAFVDKHPGSGGHRAAGVYGGLRPVQPFDAGQNPADR